MSNATFAAFDVSIATTQLTSAACYDNLQALDQPQNPQQRHLSMNWVVVTDNRGMRRLRLQWRNSDSSS